MEQELQISIIKELRRQVANRVNVDAGVMYKNPTSVYTCPKVAQKEWTTFFREHPQLIGLSCDLPKPHSYKTVDDFGVPVIATRDSEGKFRAFVNSCRHRGTRVATDARGESKRFVCPFHNWAYSSGGELVGIPQENHFGKVDKSCHGLIELPAVEHLGLLFVHPQPDGQIDIDALLGRLAPELADAGLDQCIVVNESETRMRLNWKLANDTFGETYHFQKLHRETLGKIVYGDALAYEEMGRNHRFVFATKAIELMCSMVPEESWNVRDVTFMNYYLFPNVQMTLSAPGIALALIYPDPSDPSYSLTRFINYMTPEAIEAEKNAGPDTKLITADNIFEDLELTAATPPVITRSAFKEVASSIFEAEDYLMGEYAQRSAENGTLDHLIFGRNEPALHHYHNTYREALGMPPLEPFENAGTAR